MGRRRGENLGRTIAAFLIFAGMAVLLRYVYQQPEPILIDGEKVRVIDGDSFAIGRVQYRIDGIDAPEYRQSCADLAGQSWACGKSARTALAAILGADYFSCIGNAKDDFGRRVVTCSDSRDRDLGAAMVSSGMAVSKEFFGIASYGEEQDAAKAARKGLWQGTFQSPQDWRAAHPRSTDK